MPDMHIKMNPNWNGRHLMLPDFTIGSGGRDGSFKFSHSVLERVINIALLARRNAFQTVGSDSSRRIPDSILSAAFTVSSMCSSPVFLKEPSDICVSRVCLPWIQSRYPSRKSFKADKTSSFDELAESLS